VTYVIGCTSKMQQNENRCKSAQTFVAKIVNQADEEQFIQ
jgi:hypothetical protein